MFCPGFKLTLLLIKSGPVNWPSSFCNWFKTNGKDTDMRAGMLKNNRDSTISSKGRCNNYQEVGGAEKLEGGKGHFITLLPR